MNEQQAIEDAKAHYSISEWLQGQKDSIAGIKHRNGTDSYNAGYNFGVWAQEHKGV